MRGLASVLLLVAFGLLIGTPIGYFFCRSDTNMAAGTNFPEQSVVLPFPKDYFAQLPSSPDGKNRLIPVDTFVYNGQGDLPDAEGTEIVLPVFVQR